jgi:penicillin-insensitive murein DD-endopeptidase
VPGVPVCVGDRVGRSSYGCSPASPAGSILARPDAGRYFLRVPKLLRLALAALALVALSPSARADEPDSTPAGVHPRRAHRHRRAKLEDPSARAPRGGASAQIEPARSGKQRPGEKAESIGPPNDGHLRGGAHLDLSKPYFRVVPAYESGDVRWGLPIMINMIDRAARTVHKRFPGAVLDVGDISQKGGGDILRHHSHESGRDADLGFYVLDARGKQIHAHGLIKFDTAMASPTVPGARYDLARNWSLIQEMLTDPAARVSHVFIAEWIRKELLAYARPRVSRALFERASMVMMQPHHSLPHDDHFHVRISCPHEAHSSCIELATNAPHGRALRVAHRGHPGHVLKTPATRPAAAPHPGKPPAASGVTPADPFRLPLPDPADEIEPDVDVRDMVDETGAPSSAE